MGITAENIASIYKISRKEQDELAYRSHMNAVNAVLLSSFIFAGVHFSLSAFLPLFFLGAVLATMQERYRSLIPAIITHALLNAATVGYVYYENFVQATTLFR